MAQSVGHFYGRVTHEEKVVGRKISPLAREPQPTSLLLFRTGAVEGEAGKVSTGGSFSSRLLLGRPDLPVQQGRANAPVAGPGRAAGSNPVTGD